MKKYVKTLGDAAEELGLSREHLCNYYMNKQGAPEKLKRGYDVQKIAEFIKSRKKPNTPPESRGKVTVRDQKTLKEIEKLDIQIGQLKGELIPLQEHNSILAYYSGMVNEMFEQWISNVSATSKDPAQVEEAERLCDSTRQQFSERLEDEAEKLRKLSKTA